LDLSPIDYAQTGIELRPGDPVCYIGNTFADRMQHHGWLETYIQHLHPDHELTFRNLGFAADELKTRPRSANFGDPNQWLTKCEADVVFCFFGYNEALRGDAGLKQFEKDLSELIDSMTAQKYNGKSAPRLVFFSPIGHENLKSPNLPDGSDNNANLKVYTESMQRICAAKQVPFVDLFNMSGGLYQRASEPLTMNGIHLLDRGNRTLAQSIIPKLFPGKTAPSDGTITQLREAVLDKNYHWFSRYRVVDGFNVYGGRSKLAWFDQSNADVMRREMEVFDVMTANRDRRVWAVATGSDLVVKDDNLPEELSVRPNKEGPLEGGAWPYLGAKEAISFEAPTEPGVYPYVCTYPGHWRRMYGALYVVPSFEQYQAQPDAYLAGLALPIKDTLLEQNTRGQQWTYDDLFADVKMPMGRSHEVGKASFKAAN
jgi:hypothetical protein